MARFDTLRDIFREAKWIILFVISMALILAVAQFYGIAFAQEYGYAWGYNEQEGYFKIHIIITDDITKYDGCLTQWKGCAVTWYFWDKMPDHAVILLEGTEWDRTGGGYNRYSHEMLHHWGYPEQSISQLFPSGDLKFKYGKDG